MILIPNMGKLLLAGMVSTTMAGCMNEYGRNERVFYGTAIGAGTGALVGGAAIGRPEGAIAGAVIGGVGGAIIGDNIGRERRYERRYRYRGCAAYDEFGNRYRVAC